MEEQHTQEPEYEIRCAECGANLIVGEHLLTARCPYCASTSVVERERSSDRPRPTFIVPFTWGADRARDRIKRWIGNRGAFAPRAFREAAIEGLRGVYVPAWLYGAVGAADYSASIGENYTRVETYTTTDSKGNTVTRTRVRTYTEWRSLTGRYQGWMVDFLVSASEGLRNEELEAVEPFDLRGLRRYDPRLLAGWIAEEASVDRTACMGDARGEAETRLGRSISAFMPGDSHRNLRYAAEFSEETAALVLLPVWIGSARYGADEEQVRILMNGQSGEVVGSVPKSWMKILALVLAVLVGLPLLLMGCASVFGLVFA
jgi:DNA-directed RNA polymerase subunit RPC12/RpoP